MSGLVQLEAGGESNFSAQDKPTWDLYSTCIHCGLCLNHCPTYRVLGVEMDSPRGRIYQVLQVDAGRLPIGESFTTHIDRCLGCLACETACPSGVKYGHIVERARAQIEQHYPRPWLTQKIRDFFFQRVLRDFGLLSRLARAMRLYQNSGLQALVRKTGILKLVGMDDLERLAPHIDDNFFFGDIGILVPAVGAQRARVVFHAGCIANVAFAELNRATVRLLAQNGVEVYIAPHQRCCGALQAHAGYREEAKHLAKRNIEAMLDGAQRYDAIITNAAGCGSMLKDYHDLVADDPVYAERARLFASKVKDVSEFLAELGLREPPTKLNIKATYQDPCHLAHAQRVRSAPREMLRAAGVEIVEMPHSDQCCGSAGTYNVSQNELSMKILDEKMNDMQTVLPEVQLVATANVGCMLQLRAGMEKRGVHLPVKHVVEVLEECY